ncbi:hypothetical protein [Pararhizobium sp. DWP3-4]|uniref:hypothetical protein n=1 Tax=Pararhizobium sp. DWP3-4 TaxID=2804565 RepID=UPI003CE8CDBE
MDAKKLDPDQMKEFRASSRITTGTVGDVSEVRFGILSDEKPYALVVMKGGNGVLLS